MKRKTLSWGDALMLMLLAAVTAGSIAFLVSYQNINSRLDSLKRKEMEYAKFDRVKENIKQYFIGSYNEDALMDGAMKGYVDALSDNSSYYLTPEEYAQVQKSLKSQNAGGVGLSIGINPKTNAKVVTEVLPGSPAEKAGIKTFDEVLAIDGKSVAGGNNSELIDDRMRGEAETAVKLELRRAATGQTYSCTLVRVKSSAEAVKGEILGGSIGLVTVSDFGDGVDTPFKSKVNELIKGGAKALIFDLRFNNEGSASGMVSALDLLLPKVLVLSVRDKNGQGQDFMSDASEIKMPMAVIVNEYSANAAEYFAAVLQEYGKAVIIGAKMTGECFDRQLIGLPDGSGIYLSTKTFITPKGINLSETGVTPDYQAAMTEQDMANFSQLAKAQDVQLQKAYSVVYSKLNQGNGAQPAS